MVEGLESGEGCGEELWAADLPTFKLHAANCLHRGPLQVPVLGSQALFSFPHSVRKHLHSPCDGISKASLIIK